MFVALFLATLAGQERHAASVAQAQGVLVPPDAARFRLPRPWPHPIPPTPSPVPPQATQTYCISELTVDASIENTLAKVQVTQTFENPSSRPLEAQFLFPLPYDGAIDRMTFLVDGKELPGKLLSREEARQRYEAIVRSSRDPALLEWVGWGMFQTSVFPVPPGGKRTVSLRFTQVLRNSQGLTDFLYPLATARYSSKPLEQLKIRVALSPDAPLANIYSPSHAVKVDRSDAEHAVVTYEAKQVVPNADFRLFFDHGQGTATASVLSYRPTAEEDGYFLLLASPPTVDAAPPLPKTVVFVVDRSGSMSGKKMEQAREALHFGINNLRDGDLFNIVAYDSEIEAFRPELQKFDDDARTAANAFVTGLFAGGNTNIDGALDRALKMLVDEKRPAYVVFLTDGLPTHGVVNESQIVSHAGEANRVRARLFAFGVGFDVNSRLLDRLSRDNSGYSAYVRPTENIETAVSELQRRIGAPAVTNVRLQFAGKSDADEAAPSVRRVYPRGEWDLFIGDQAVVTGRYRSGGEGKFIMRGG
ncbi:MAG: VWA domain-containing protein, partial [Planctomycetales bacterium]|nr:VWA domain-containing protein [Planctomycetales bacterium]